MGGAGAARARGLGAAGLLLSAGGLVEAGLVQDVEPAAWARECLRAWQVTGSLLTDDYLENVGKSNARFSHHDLVGMPSGLCTDSLTCAFTNCNVSGVTLGGGAWPALREFDADGGDLQALALDNNITLNLPEQIAFPNSVKDVVEIVEYAKATGMPISIKTSGHSYPGSSTLAGSVNINLRDFPKYSQVPMLRSWVTDKLPAVTPCNADVLAAGGHEMTAACKLAQARGKPATLRVGGGEVWDDAYRAVDNANYWLQAVINQTVMVMGGGSGSVSAAGGWMQGGGLSNGAERVYGFGADNVLELEMVLASGQHVKFGPSEWQAAEGFLYPKTTEVQGFCNTNVTAAEDEWLWDECEEAVPFEDLWYAVRGGGGGTYGVVTAVTYQLHPRRTIDWLTIPDKSAYTDACPTKFNIDYIPEWEPSKEAFRKALGNETLPEGCAEVQNAFADFFIDLLFDPAAINISEETSLNCGDFGLTFYIPAFNNLHCHDGGGEEVMEAWTAYWQNYTGPVPEAMVATWGAWVNDSLAVEHPRSYGSHAISLDATYDSFRPEGIVRDDPPPQTVPIGSYSWSALIPPEFFLQKNDDVHDMVREGNPYHITGGHVGIAHDQMTAVSEIQRLSGAQATGMQTAEHWLPRIQAFYPAPPSPGTILGGIEFNHIGSDAFGPLKTDNSAYCPGNLTHAEREASCMSAQEFTWGTEGLRRLEAIKAEVDPQGLFQCQKCVGFKGPPGAAAPN